MKPKNQTRLLTVFVLAFATFLQTATARSWTPDDTATVAWYDAADAPTVLTTNEISVTNWIDKSGNGNDLVQGVGSQQPTYTASDSLANNMGSIFSSAGGSVGLDIINTNNITFGSIYAVVYHDDGTDTVFSDYNTLMCNTTNTTDSRTRNYRIMGKSGDSVWFNSNHFDSSPTVNGGTNDTDVAYPMPLKMFRFYNAGGSTQPITIGFNKENSSRGWNGGYCEFVFTDGTEDLATRQQIEGYLAWKWGIQAKLPTDHPYFNTGPTTPDAGTVLIVR